ncbi:MAG: Lrp/AsnC family transcriptional regulator [Vulcanimicrobiaceae bacterium]
MTEKSSGIDAIDRDILAALERDGRATYLELGRIVSLSPNAVADRVRRLERVGVICGFGVKIAPEALGLGFHALLDVKLTPDRPADAFERDLAEIPAIVGYALTTGRFDYTLRVACADRADLVRLVEHLRTKGGAAETYSRVVLREHQFPLTRPLHRVSAPLK